MHDILRCVNGIIVYDKRYWSDMCSEKMRMKA